MRFYFIAVALLAIGLAACTHDKTAKTNTPPTISVGIMTTDSLTVTELDSTGTHLTTYNLTPDMVDSVVTIAPSTYGSVLEVKDVTIGVGFHWQQKEPQQFEGSLRIINNDGHLVVINDIDIERYLESVISSEMSASASKSLLEAHAIVSRSWLLSQLSRQHSRETRSESTSEITVWYDRDDHTLFDVCADDHCQRYQGVTRRSTPQVAEAVRATRGMVLMYHDTICDARYSKCCGGATELFENCWEPERHPYLPARYDGADSTQIKDLAIEQNAIEWITSRPDAYCASPSTETLVAVLNSYDRATVDYYRWNVTYRADSLGQLIALRSGRDLGYIKSLQPLERGTSGRITRLLIVGNKDSLIVGKELEIRRVLSPSHLYSSAFTLHTDGQGPTSYITIEGAGWGHGVGMCQIGAAVMGEQGFTSSQIIEHYFPAATLTQLY